MSSHAAQKCEAMHSPEKLLAGDGAAQPSAGDGAAQPSPRAAPQGLFTGDSSPAGAASAEAAAQEFLAPFEAELGALLDPLADDIADRHRSSGIDPTQLARQQSEADKGLPSGWRSEQAPDGRLRYVKRSTGETTFERPFDRCGTFGCVLEDRHRGFHVFQDTGAAGTGRTRRGAGGGSSAPPRAPSPPAPSFAHPKSTASGKRGGGGGRGRGGRGGGRAAKASKPPRPPPRQFSPSFSGLPSGHSPIQFLHHDKMLLSIA